MHVPDRTFLKFYQRLTNRWHLTDEDSALILGLTRVEAKPLPDYLQPVQLSIEQKTKISYLVNIYDGVHRLFGDPEYADRWVYQKNTYFDGKAPIDLLRSGDVAGFRAIHEYIQSALTL